MPKSRKKNARKSTAPEPQKTTRRDVLRWLRNGAIALPVVGVAGVLSVRSVEATICEADLTKIGKGVPSVVQIHDPMCSQCVALQKQTRKALRGFEGDQFNYLVANINTADGGALAARFGVSNVTLLLFDARGIMTQVVRGPSNASALETVFQAHIGMPQT